MFFGVANYHVDNEPIDDPQSSFKQKWITTKINENNRYEKELSFSY